MVIFMMSMCRPIVLTVIMQDHGGNIDHEEAGDEQKDEDENSEDAEDCFHCWASFSMRSITSSTPVRAM